MKKLNILSEAFNSFKEEERTAHESALEILDIIVCELGEADKITRNVSIPNNFYSNGTNIIVEHDSSSDEFIRFIDINQLK